MSGPDVLYPLDRDLSSGERYLTLEQAGTNK